MPCFLLKQVAGLGVDDDDVGLHLLHHLVSPPIAQSAHGQAGAVVLIVVAPVVLGRGRDIERVMRAVVEIVITFFLRQKHVREVNAKIMVNQSGTGVVAERDTKELAAKTVSFR